MKRQTGKAHGFEHGQTILFAGQGLEPTEPVKAVFNQTSRRIMIRLGDGKAVSIHNSVPFWAAPTITPEGVLASMVAEYVADSRRMVLVDHGREQRLYGWAQSLIHVAMIVYGLSEEDAAERVGDMINDVETGMC